MFLSSVINQRISRRPILKIALTLVAIIVTLISVWPASAAVELNYFSVVPSSSAILLEWSTAKEYNLVGFQLMCKQVGETDLAYHPIVTKSVKGGPTEGATYDHLVTGGLKPGVPYCFRLREITINGEPGQVFDRCGYGLSITPTPTLEARFLAETATAQVFANATEAMLALLQPTIDPLILTLTPQPPLSPLGTPNLVMTQQAIFAQQTAQAVAAAAVQQLMFDATATAVALGLPATETAVAAIQQQIFDATATANALSIPATETAIALTLTPNVNSAGAENGTPQPPVSPLPQDGNSQNSSLQDPNLNAAGANLPPPENAVQPLTDPFPVAQSPEVAAQQTQEAASLQAVQTSQAMQIEQSVQATQIFEAQQVAQSAQMPQTEQPVQIPANPVSPDSPLALAAGDAAAYPYVVITAEPSQTPALVAATLTPLPTNAPTMAPFFASIWAPTAQNMTIGLLFIVFLGATGIGFLGLLSGVLYVRSRSRRRRQYDY